MNPIVEKVYQIGIIPVIAFNSVDEALPLCKALAEGGLPAAEVTFRTACAEECIRKIHEEMPEMLLGAGTVLTCEQADRAMLLVLLSSLLPASTRGLQARHRQGPHHDARHRFRRRDAAGYEHGLRGSEVLPR